jgi:exonuclease III
VTNCRAALVLADRCGNARVPRRSDAGAGRVITGSVAAMHVINAYVVNGKALGSAE